MKENTNEPAIPAKSGGWVRRIFLLLLLAFIVIQFFQPNKNNNDVYLNADIRTVVEVPDSVEALLKIACYDCHSNNTDYPWYSNIQPVAWWLNHHVEEGKKELNFNEFASMLARNGKTTKQRQIKKLDDIKDEIKEDEMPLQSYVLMHKEARLSPAEKKMLIDWAEGSKQVLEKPRGK